MRVERMEAGRWFVAHASSQPGAGHDPVKPWVAASWLFLVEPLGVDRCRLISRYRCACSGDLSTRISFGPALIEPIGFAMDRRMLLGVKERAEREARSRSDRAQQLRGDARGALPSRAGAGSSSR
jgi:hypothetical protein